MWVIEDWLIISKQWSKIQWSTTYSVRISLSVSDTKQQAFI